MKNARKLIPALAMLLVSAVMMSTASFAWFTMNSTVEANNMQIAAVAPDSIWISQSNNSGWLSAITFENENASMPGTLNPTKANSDWTFSELTSEAAQLVKNDGTLDLTDGMLTDSTSFFKDVVYIKLDGRNSDGTNEAATAKLYVTASIASLATTPKDEIYKAIKVAVVVDGNTCTFEFAELSKATAAQELVTLVAGAQQATAVTVYAWIDGTDTDCKNANAFNEEKFDIDLVFTIQDPAQNG